MDWDTVILFTLAIVGAALIVGGIIAYRGSTMTGVRAFSSSVIEGNTPGILEGLVVYRLKDDGTNDVYTFCPGEDHLIPEDGQIFKGQDVWTRWTAL